MKTKGAILWGAKQDWSVEEIDMGEPKAGEVLVRLAASGLCHSDEHIVTGDQEFEAPILGGHEGAGIIERVGEGVANYKAGDHVVISAIPGCGDCYPCRIGHQNVCDFTQYALTGHAISDLTKRVTVQGKEAGQFCMAGTFAPYTTVNQASLAKVPDEMDLKVAALLGCGATAGYMAAARVADVRPGDNVVVVGLGGLGASALMASAAAGANMLIVIDPVPFKREQAKLLGATHTYASIAEAEEPIRELTHGLMAHKVILTPGEVTGAMIQPALELTAKLGILTIVGMGSFTDNDAQFNPAWLTAMNKQIRGSQMGGGAPRQDVRTLADLYISGKYPIDKMITRTYALEDINQGYQDMRDAKNVRGVIHYGEADW